MLKRIDWRARMAVDLLTFAIFYWLLADNGAPAWAKILFVYIGTRSSSIQSSADSSAIQSTIRINIKEGEA